MKLRQHRIRPIRVESLTRSVGENKMIVEQIYVSRLNAYVKWPLSNLVSTCPLLSGRFVSPSHQQFCLLTCYCSIFSSPIRSDFQLSTPLHDLEELCNLFQEVPNPHLQLKGKVNNSIENRMKN